MRKKSKPLPDFGPRWTAGYTEYRYGVMRVRGEPVSLKSRVTLAQPHLTSAPIFRGQKRKSLIDQTIDVMRDWRKTPFENEGAVRAGMRSALCLGGYGWQRSDDQVAYAIAEALRLMGAVRPDHDEGQPNHANGNDYCHWCCCPIDEEDRSRGRRFCSVECARSGVEHMARKTTHHYGAVLRSAIRIIDCAKAPPQTCEYCERSFQSDRKARFCSNACAGLFQAGGAVYQDRDCEFCHKTFHPVSLQQKYCSQSCSRRAHLKAEAESLTGLRRICECCGATFQPKVNSARFCTPRCAKRSGQRAYAERNRPAPPPTRPCSWCGGIYQPKINPRPGPSYCCSQCASDAARFTTTGATPRKLTRAVLDHFVIMPLDEQWKRRLTTQRLDWFLMERGLRITGEVSLAA